MQEMQVLTLGWEDPLEKEMATHSSIPAWEILWTEKSEFAPQPQGFPDSSAGKESSCNAGDPGSIPGLGRSPGEGNGNPLQYSCLENSMGREAWWAIAHGIAKSWTKLSKGVCLGVLL